MHRHWVPVNSPIWDGDEVVGIVHQVNDVSYLRANALSAVEQYRDLLANSEMTSQEAKKYQAMIAAFTGGLVNYNALADEVVQLREALHTRGTIEQAKGLLMATRNCGPDDAFGILAKMSQDTNVKLADVAAALIYQFGVSN